MQIRHATINEFAAAIQQANSHNDYDLEMVFTSGRDGNFRARIVPRFARALDAYGKDTGDLAKGARYSANAFHATPRRLRAACWHAHRDVFRALFALAPDAIVRTGLGPIEKQDDGSVKHRDTVYNAANFEATYGSTAYVNVGSEMYPRRMPDLCDC
jgi:hypothetical protein